MLRATIFGSFGNNAQHNESMYAHVRLHVGSLSADTLLEKPAVSAFPGDPMFAVMLLLFFCYLSNTNAYQPTNTNT